MKTFMAKKATRPTGKHASSQSCRLKWPTTTIINGYCAKNNNEDDDEDDPTTKYYQILITPINQENASIGKRQIKENKTKEQKKRTNEEV